jgi:peptide/nickel transport system permease protein
MWQYLVKRFSLLGVTLVGICVLSFIIVTNAPGDPTAAMLHLDSEGKGKQRTASLDQVIENTKRALYLDRPAVLNTSPNTRRKVAHDLVAKLFESTQRKGAHDDLTGIGTASLDVLVEELPARSETAGTRLKEFDDLAAKLDTAAVSTADAAALVEPLDARFQGKGPRFSRKATSLDRAKAWASWIRDRATETRDSLNELLAVLDEVVPAEKGGLAPRGTPAEKVRAWTDWWQKNASRYSADAAARAVESYMQASDADRPARTKELEQIGGVAVPEVMSAYRSSSGKDRSHAAYALSLVGHIKWDLTETPEKRTAYEREWKEKKDKLEGALKDKQIEEGVFDARTRELGTSDEYVAGSFRKQFASDERNIARWWFRSEENFVDFSAPRQAARAFTQTQFGNWFRGLLLGFDFGTSYTFNKDVLELIKERLPVTLWLNFFSIFLTYVIAIPLGIYSAARPRTLIDRITTLVLFILYSLPSFWVGSILILLLTGPPGVNWFPSHGMSSMDSENLSAWQWFKDVMWHLALPTVCLTYGGIAAISRYMRAGMLETIRQDYIRTARAKGLSESVVIFKHALRNSLIPILTLLAYLLPSMFGGSIIIESIFSIDGLGKLMFDAIIKRDYPVIMSEVVISGFLTLFGILLADISYRIVDPRIELK